MSSTNKSTLSVSFHELENLLSWQVEIFQRLDKISISMGKNPFFLWENRVFDNYSLNRAFNQLEFLKQNFPKVFYGNEVINKYISNKEEWNKYSASLKCGEYIFGTIGYFSGELFYTLNCINTVFINFQLHQIFDLSPAKALEYIVHRKLHIELGLNEKFALIDKIFVNDEIVTLNKAEIYLKKKIFSCNEKQITTYTFSDNINSSIYINTNKNEVENSENASNKNTSKKILIVAILNFVLNVLKTFFFQENILIFITRLWTIFQPFF